MNKNILITDGHWRKTLAAVRGLGKNGLHVTVGETTRLNTSAFSRHCARSWIYPSPSFEPSDFIDRIMEKLSDRSYQMVLPMEDVTLERMTEYHPEISQYTYLPAVSHEKLLFVQQKDNILKLAERLGIPVPKTWFIQDLGELITLKDHLPYPVVIKPKKGSGAVGVSYINNQKQLLRQYELSHRKFSYPMIQETIPREGTGYGASFLMDEKSRVRACFMHKRLREYPITGGASTLRESVQKDDIREMGQTLLKKLDWFGPAMVEFKLDPRDNTPKLMEINPRFWGSLALAIESGVNFPYLLYRMSKGDNFKPVEHYQIGKKCRWLLPGDLLHFIRNPNRRQIEPGFFNFHEPDTTYDIISLKDPLPVLGRILTPLTFLYDRDMKARLRAREK